MLRLIGIIISIAAADAVNPSTLVPAMYIAAREGDGPGGSRRAFWKVAQFGAGVLTTTVTGGLVMLLGPGELILDLVPKPTPDEVDWLQTAAGIVLMLGALIVWRARGWLARRQANSSGDDAAPSRRPTFLLGAGIAGAGLPANVAYIGAIATIVDSGQGTVNRLALLGIYDLIFILPMAAILAVLGLMPHRSAAVLGVARRLLERHFITALIAVLAAAGVVVLALGVSGLASQ